jgi:hypothetical protein
MNFFRNIFSNSTKTDEDLDLFINKKFTYYLNNSNLLLNFVSDFEDYKITGRNDNKSKCDECESLYILTSEIFENYINRVKIPFDIPIYSEGKEKSNINYKNKVLYFFDIKDLNKILQSKNLARSSEDTKLLNKKRILCKIISLSFIKIYIIIKSIFQTFNNYDSLIRNKTTSSGNLFQEDEVINPTNEFGDTQEDKVIATNNTFGPPPTDNTFGPPPAHNTFGPPPTDNTFGPPPAHNTFGPPPTDNTFGPPTDNTFDNTAINTQENPFINETDTTSNTQENPFGATTDTTINTQENQFITNTDNTQENPFISPPTGDTFNTTQANTQANTQLNNQLTGGGFFDFLNPFSRKNESQQIEIPPVTEYQRVTKLQTSNNVFYSIFVILFENELTAKNFTASNLNNKLDILSNEIFISKIPDILEYIYSKDLYEPGSSLKNSIIFNNNNFKFLKLKTSDTLENDATYYLREIDEKYTLDNSITSKETKQYFSPKNLEFIKNYSIIKNYDLTNLSILSSVKGILQTMISNYFKTRNTLYDSIIKKLIKFNPRTNEIENINPNLTYENIVKLTNQTKTILLNLHSNVFESLNNIITKIRESILRKYGDQFDNMTTNNRYKENETNEANLLGGKTRKKYYKKHYKKYYKKHYKKTKKYNLK